MASGGKPPGSMKEWLDSLDLGSFFGHFLQSGVTELSQVRRLTETDLGVMGITQRGYQKRILSNLPSEAEAALSEFAARPPAPPSPAEPLVPPTPPPRGNCVPPSQPAGPENGHSASKTAISLDDEMYLLCDPTAGIIPSLAPRRSLTLAQGTGVSSKDSDSPVPVLPPRSSEPKAATPSEGPRPRAARPTPQPRIRSLPSDPGVEAKPPPLPGRDEKPEERPQPKPREMPQVPPRHGLSQLASPPPPCAQILATSLLTPPPIFPQTVPSEEDNFPDLPPPPPPKGSSAAPVPPSRIPLAEDRLLRDPRKSPIQHSELSTAAPPPSLPPMLQPESSPPDGSRPGLSAAQEVPAPTPKLSFLSPPPVLPGPLESGGAEFLPLPSLPSRPAPPCPGDSAAASQSLPVLPPREMLPRVPPQPPSHPPEEVAALTAIPTGPSIPTIPPRPPVRMHDVPNGDLPPPVPSLRHAPAPPQMEPLGTREESPLPPQSLPPAPLEMPVIPPLPVSLPEPEPSFLSQLPPPPPSPLGITKSASLSLFDAAQKDFDPFAFDPFDQPDNSTERTVCTMEAPLRPPSLFCNPEEYDNEPPIGPTPLPTLSELPLPPPPPPTAPNTTPPSTFDPGMLMSRPVPLPPGARPREPTSTAELGCSQKPVDSLDGNIFPRPAPGDPSRDRLELQPTENAVLSQGDPARASQISLEGPPLVPPPRPSASLGPSSAAGSPSPSPQVSRIAPDRPGSHSSSLMDLSSEGNSAEDLRPAADNRVELRDCHNAPIHPVPAPPLTKDRQDIEDQYSKVYRPPKPPQEMPPAMAPQIPARPPPVPCARVVSAPQNAGRKSSSAEPGSSPSSSLRAPVSPSSLSEGSDCHSYILLCESSSGTVDISDESILPDELSSAGALYASVGPLSSSTLDKRPGEQQSSPSPSAQDGASAEGLKLPPMPARRAPLPPTPKAGGERAQPPQLPKLPARPSLPSLPALPAREYVPAHHQPSALGGKEDDYDFLDPQSMGRRSSSPLRDEPLDSPDRIAFKELAQSEESGDDEELDSFDEGKASHKQVPDVPVEVNLADRCSKMDLSHIMRIGKSYRESKPPVPLARTHSRALDENTRNRLSKKLSESLLERNAPAEVPVKVVALKKKGYLWKQGGKQNNKGFRKRWMDFDGYEMRYYENERTLSECKGIIPVGTMRDVKNLCGANKTSFGDSKQHRITLETTGRSFHFAAETLQEGTLWANILMQAILAYKPPPGGFPIGGDMTCPDKKGYMKVEGYHQKRFIAVKGEKMLMYSTAMDFESAVAILEIQMKLASVKELPKNKIQLATPTKISILTLENPQECKDWLEAFRDAIQEGLSDHSILEKIQQNPSNRFCADCSMKDPDWASINMGISICKNCSGLHRKLGVHVSKVRSLKMDTKVWTAALVQVMLELGNDRANAFWEANLKDGEKPMSDDSLEARQVFILSKYKDRKYCKARPVTEKSMDKNLVRAASICNLEECMQLVFSGANVGYAREDGKTATEVAAASDFHAVVEFLNQNLNLQVLPPKSDGLASKALPRPERTVPIAKPESKQEDIYQEGYLLTQANNKKDFLRRYCTLRHGIFSLFEEKNQPVKSTIEGIDMVLIAIAEPKPGHKFCFEISTTVGKSFLLSAETEAARKSWMVSLAKIHSLVCMWESLNKDFLQAGFLHKKEGAATTNWQRLWFILQGKSLVSYSIANDELEDIDLRKLISMSRQDTDSVAATDYSHTLSMVLPGKNIYLRAETKQAADCWYETLQRVASQGGTSLEDQPLTGDGVPIFVSQCLDFVATHEGYMTEGIYRLNGTSSVIRKITAASAEDPRNARLKDEYSVHDVTGALKKFFRELPDPLLSSALYQKWTEVASYQDHSVRLQWYKYLLGELPPVKYNTLKLLIGHLKHISDHSNMNKMYIRNLASVFGPTLMASHNMSFVHAEREIAVINDLLTYYAWLYEVSDEEMAKQREKELKYQEGLSKFRAAQASEVQSSTEQLMLMEVFIGKKQKGNSVNIRISMDHMTDEIVKMALESQKLIDDGSWCLYEIIAKGELERMFHGYERVLPQALSWNHPSAADNYICLKENDLLRRIEPFMDQTTLSDTVRYSESKKHFKKYSFELMNNVVTCYKDKNASPANSWKVGDMKIYVGVEKKRSPPTQWGISFTVNNEEGVKAICLDSESSFNFWLAGLLKSKQEASNSVSESSVTDPASLVYTSPTVSFKSDNESSLMRYSRHIPKELSSITSKMSFWRKSRLNSIDDS